MADKTESSSAHAGPSSQQGVLCRGLIIGCSRFGNPQLPSIPEVLNEVQAAAQIFDPEHVQLLLNPTISEAQRALMVFLDPGETTHGGEDPLRVVILSTHSTPVDGQTGYLMRDSDWADLNSLLWPGRYLFEPEDSRVPPRSIATLGDGPVLFILDGPFTDPLGRNVTMRPTRAAVISSGGGDGSSDSHGSGFLTRLARAFTDGNGGFDGDATVELDELYQQLKHGALESRQPVPSSYTQHNPPIVFLAGTPLRTLPLTMSGTAARVGRTRDTPTLSDLPRAGPAPSGNSMRPGEVLQPRQSIVSNNGQYRLVYQADGNLVLYEGANLTADHAIWATDTDGRPAGVCVAQDDGNVVIYGADDEAIWASNTDGNPGSYLVVMDDGNLVLFNADGSATLWNARPRAASSGESSAVEAPTTGEAGSARGRSHDQTQTGPNSSETASQFPASVDPASAESETSPWPLEWDGVLLMRWAEAVRAADPQDGGRAGGTPLDVINGALLGAVATLHLPPGSNDPVAQALLQTLETAQRPLQDVLSAAVGPLTRMLPADPPEPTPDDLRRHAPTLTLAASIATKTTAQQPTAALIEQRHLLAAALTTSELPVELVTALGCDRVELAARLLTVVTDGADEAAGRAWTSILAPDELTSTFTSDYVPVTRRGRGNRRPSDLVDSLDVDVYVTMLAAMIARRSTAMPVSIGLFGEWGSGKSYFMELLRQKVEALSDPEATSRTAAATGTSPYCGDIVQITFNAWNYSDTNLWASLAAEFFSQLGAPDVDPDEARRLEIRRTLKNTNEVRQELQSIRDSAEDRATQIRTTYAKKAAERERRARSLSGGVVKAVLADPEVRTRLDNLTKQLGLDDDQERVLQLAEDVNGIRDDISATRRVLAQRSLRWPFWILLGVVGALSAAALLPWDWADVLNTGAVTGIITFLTAVGVIVTRSRSAVGELRGVAEAAVRARDKVAAGGDSADIDRLAAELHTAEAEEALAQAQLHEIDAAIAQLNRQLLEYEPGRRLYEFIADRAASVDYRSQLGVVSMVRHDFEQLVKLMKNWREKAEATQKVEAAGTSAASPAPPRPMDRIVLYIDDLDRCEPAQVVQVLQAVHLLLAMDLFVVVVGVDPRWLLRALRTQYADILSRDAAGSSDAEEELAGFAEATPQNYLEKIFQVPFVLPGMTPGGFDNLVRSFAPKNATGTSFQGMPDSNRDARAGDRAAQEAAAHVPASERPAATPTDPATPPGSAQQVTPQMAVDDTSDIAAGLADSGLQLLTAISATPISKRELDLLARLSGLVRTPRSATRLFNLYGLLRSARDLRRGRPFLGDRGQPGDYEAVILLLGVLIGAPELLGLMLWGRPADDGVARGLCRTTGPGDWYAFVDSLEPGRGAAGAWSNAVAGTIDDEEAEAWRDLISHLQALRAWTTLRDIERYRDWGPQVARFSFVLSGFATTPGDDLPPREGTHP